MAWTTPRTWTDGELVTAAIMNAHVRDQLNAIFPIMRVRKTADETVTSNATPQNDDQLLFAIAASEVWLAQCVLHYTNNNVANSQISIDWAVPAGATGTWGHSAPQGTLASSSQAIGVPYSSIGTTQSANQLVLVYVTVVNSGTAGNVTLKWAQTTSNGTGTVVRTNSTLLAHRIA